MRVRCRSVTRKGGTAGETIKDNELRSLAVGASKEVEIRVSFLTRFSLNISKEEPNIRDAQGTNEGLPSEGHRARSLTT